MRKDLSTKIISLLFAIFMWFYIIQVQDPEIEKNIKDVPVQFTKSQLEERGLTLTNDKEVQIDVKVRGQRKHITSIKKEDVAAVADVSNINSTGTHEININVILPYGGVELLEQNPQHIAVTVDEFIVAEKEILINQTGNPKTGYCVSDYKVTPEKVKIKGPKSIISTIEELAVDVDVGGTDEDVTVADAPIRFIGTSGEIFNTPYVTLETETADVHCTIAKKKTVAIEAIFSENVNYVLAETAVKSIEIAGDVEIIEGIEKIKTSVITNDMITENGEAEVILELPEGVKSLGGDKITLKLKTVIH